MVKDPAGLDHMGLPHGNHRPQETPQIWDPPFKGAPKHRGVSF